MASNRWSTNNIVVIESSWPAPIIIKVFQREPVCCLVGTAITAAELQAKAKYSFETVQILIVLINAKALVFLIT